MPSFTSSPCEVQRHRASGDSNDGRGVYPLDDALGLVAGCKQLDMQHAAAQLVTEVPYDTAQALFGDLTGMPCGSERLPT